MILKNVHRNFAGHNITVKLVKRTGAKVGAIHALTMAGNRAGGI